MSHPLMSRQELLERYASGERNFSRINLRGRMFEDDVELIDIILTQATWNRITIHHAYLMGASFQSSNLIEIRFAYARLMNANFQQASLVGVSFEGANLSGADFTGAKLRNVDFSNANLTDVSFLGAEIDGVTQGENILHFSGTKSLDDSILVDCIEGIVEDEETLFCNTVMPNGSIRNCSRVITAEELLQRYAAGERRFDKIILHRADLRGADLQEIRCNRAHLIDTDLSEAQLSRIQFDWVYLSGVNLDGSNLKGAGLEDCRLFNVSLRGANLTSADLTESIWYNCDLTRVKWNKARLICTRFWKTIYPDGSRPMCWIEERRVISAIALVGWVQQRGTQHPLSQMPNQI